MIFEADDFVFEPPREIAFARRVLIKPCAGYSEPHPTTTSRETLAKVIQGIKKVSPADILLLEKSAGTEPIHSIYKNIGYDFERIILLDVDQCIPVAIENPLPKPYVMSTFWLPNVILSCDYLITISPFKTLVGKGHLTIANLMGLLPTDKYQREMKEQANLTEETGIDNAVADLYFTLPFDLGIVDGRKKLISDGDTTRDRIEDFGKIFVGPPYDVDKEASLAANVETPYLNLIERAKVEIGE